jgi:hypothetical protein
MKPEPDAVRFFVAACGGHAGGESGEVSRASVRLPLAIRESPGDAKQIEAESVETLEACRLRSRLWTSSGPCGQGADG